MTYTVGIDVVEVSEIEESIARLGERYLERVFSRRELDSSGGGGDARRLATCFAAKEAVLKALGVDDDAVDLREIELLGDETDPTVALAQRSASLAPDVDVSRLAVSVGSTRLYASAIVIAERDATERLGGHR